MCADEIRALDGDYSEFSGADALINPQHVFSYDMDFFGKKSFFQSINRTSLSESEKYLADLFLENSAGNISEKQNEVKQFQNKPEFCLNYRVALKSIDEPFNQEDFLAGIRNYTRLIPEKAALISLIYGVVSVLLFLLVFINLITWQMLLIPFFAGLAITGLYLKNTGKIQLKSGKISGSLDGISDALEKIENESDLKINQTEKKSGSIRQFKAIISALDQGNNIFFALFANGFFLWTLRHACRAENWILKNSHELEDLCLLINKTDALVSMGNYAFTHPHFAFPAVVQNGQFQIEATGLGHPLLGSKKCVKNDFQIRENNFLIITGANMAGKSTFLRSAGISIIMANAGLPVCAEHFIYKPVKLISSMRSSDSLVNDESYFFAELKRLKMIVDTIETDSYFIILDEILKGTNSKDKEDGSRKFYNALSPQSPQV
ncbi:MAG: DNA mismatch repair protein MutS [Crocinitomicaceae bacterium]|nr:DNA mismatch repair protein MutS [Crocinitomicaceae bacterium]